MENEIKAIIEKRVSAIKDRNVEMEMANYSKDVISYDVVGQLKYVGADAIKNRLNEWLSTLDQIIDFEITDVKITSTSEIAYCCSLNHINAKTFNGNKLEMFWRETACFKKMQGIWKITHVHSSVPFNAENGMASTRLKPHSNEQNVTEKSPSELVKSVFRAFQNQEREKLENLLSSEFIFSSPHDKRLNKEQYFEICYPFSEKIKAFEFQSIVEKGNEVFVIYKCSSIDQDDFINTEYFTIENGKIKSVNVFFGNK